MNKDSSRIELLSASVKHCNKMHITESDYKKFLILNKGLSEKSIRTYLIRFRVINKWLAERKLLISKKIVEEFLYEKKEKENLSNAGVNTYIQTIKHLDACFKHNGLDSGFSEGINGLPKERKITIPLSIDEVKKLLNTKIDYQNKNRQDYKFLDEMYLTLTEFIVFTGCRADEALSLTIKDLDIDQGRALLIKTKNKQPRFLFFDEPVKTHLRKLVIKRNSENLLFVNRKGKKIHEGDFGNNLKRRAIQAGITKRIYPHLLRHTYASQYYNSTHDIAMTATLLGHKDMNVTYDTYVHLDTEGIQLATKRHPLLSDYIPVSAKLANIKTVFDNLKIDQDERLEYQVSISETELSIRIKRRGLVS